MSDEPWSMIEPLIPVKPRRTRNTGRYPTPDRACLTGILFVLLTGIQWEHLPQEMGCGCGMNRWHRLRDWPCRRRPVRTYNIRASAEYRVLLRRRLLVGWHVLVIDVVYNLWLVLG